MKAAGSTLPVLVVVAGILALWYALAVAMNAGVAGDRAAREGVAMPPPGDTRPAVLEAGFDDPALAALEGPLPRWREALATQAERLRDLSIRQCLGLTFGAVVLMLAMLAWLEGR